MVVTPTPYEALLLCLERAGSPDSELGRQAALARALNCSHTAVSKMISARRMSVPYVLPAERLFGVSRHHLRPDIYPIEHPNAPPSWKGVDQGLGRVSFQTAGVSQPEAKAARA